ncbi:polysaccharide deacetylase family protein [Alkalihalobacillus hemicellulosilyticus]|uniref:Polysaccharide deacetylase n=1 Tax=Halalkalibacter hemicellulosilyticusJCM 9152 TaxID=1236971 RepID=W4QBF3_9BACI|nr:polysaccharide deacetylase family protein [Halalkalibacter hemicellulosilyticus]GAE29297.1 polysaccharide deacetylase [Halalkalibacter hemicellulosilyticusJCM 9152]
MGKKFIHICTFAIVVLISFSFVQNPFSTHYLHTLKYESEAVLNEQDPLYKQIMVSAKEYEEPAIDARIDRVWKAVPGYNGIRVDIDATYERVKGDMQFDERKIVFEEVAPSIHLDDLPPAAIYKGNEEKQMVAFLINVAWGNEYIPDILKTLKKHNIHVTFFLDGSWVKKNPQLAKMLIEEGHEIGNHAYSHPDMSKLTKERVDEELERTNKAIEAALEVTPKWFAPPSGSYNQAVVDRAEHFGMKTVMWSVDTIDWRNPSVDEMVQRVTNKLHPGAMVLMHPTESAAGGLEQLILNSEEKGFKVGTVSELLSEKRVLLNTFDENRRSTNGQDN